MAKDEAPTLFQVNGPVGLATWKDYCYDLSKSDVYKDVESDDYVLKDGDAAVCTSTLTPVSSVYSLASSTH